MELLTAADAEARQRRFAGLLGRRGLRPGDRLAVVAGAAGGSGDHLCLILAAQRVGVVPVLLNPALLLHELAGLLADADPSATVTDADLPGWAELARSAPEADLAPWPLARPMHYTSGTTGRPKGVHSGVLAEQHAATLVAEEREMWCFDGADLHLVCGPLHHSAPVRFATGTLLAGGSVLLPGRFSATTHAEAISRRRPTTAFAAPAHLQRLLDLGPALPDLRSFRLVAHAGAPCPEPLKRRILAAFPAGSAWEFYGSTEGQCTACSPEEWLERPGTVGRSRPGRRVEVAAGGVVWCHVPPHARFEYWRDPEKTAAAWRGDAFTVWDLGRLDGDGYLFLDGRRDDLVISGGVNVYPAEVERALESLPGVAVAAVFGRDDERWGQRVCAAVVGETTAESVMDGARRLLAPYKCPKEVHVVAEIPTTPTGKVRRATLAEDLGLPAATTGLR